MGLDTSHDAWHGAYSAFTRWRNKLAEVAGYGLQEPTPEERAQSFVGKYPAIDWDRIVPKNFEGEWDETPTDALIVLIAHSDCDGVLHPAQAGPLADRLAELLPLLPEGEGGGHIGDWHTKTQKFIDGLRAAVASGEDVDFH